MPVGKCWFNEHLGPSVTASPARLVLASARFKPLQRPAVPVDGNARGAPLGSLADWMTRLMLRPGTIAFVIRP